eukprot:scaffold7502_cov444-Prasinococcus_capsulatus_cf.AAC.1
MRGHYNLTLWQCNLILRYLLEIANTRTVPCLDRGTLPAQTWREQRPSFKSGACTAGSRSGARGSLAAPSTGVPPARTRGRAWKVQSYTSPRLTCTPAIHSRAATKAIDLRADLPIDRTSRGGQAWGQRTGSEFHKW